MKPKLLLSTLAFMLMASALFSQTPEGFTCDQAIAIECGNSYDGYTAGVPNDNATSGTANVACGTSVGTSGQMWYSVVGSGNLLTITTCGAASYDTKIHVFSGVCGALECVASNDDACSLQSTVSVATIENTTYLIRVGGFGSTAGTFTLSTSCNDVQGGCMDPGASNYDPEATYSDESCIYTGCTDPAALNYDVQANDDDGSCEYCNGEGSYVGQLYVCAFSNGAALNLTISDSQGNVVQTVGGLANNAIQYFDICLMAGECYTATMSNGFGDNGWYNGYFWINANGDQVINESLNINQSLETAIFSIDGTCANIPGCMDETAANYNAEANTDDGSCVYAPSCETGTIVLINMVTSAFPSEVSFVITDASGNVIYTGDNYFSSGAFNDFLCLGDGCYTVVMTDSFGDGWNGAILTLSGNGLSMTYTITQGFSGVGVFSVNAEGCEPNVVSGCTNPTADNYDAAALIDDGSCVYSGCTDPTAMNYNYSATIDDGSCTYCNGEGSVLASLYICTFSNGGQVELQIVDDQGNEVYYAFGLNNSAIVNAQLCLQPGVCYTANMINNTGPFGWYNGYFWVNVNGIQIVNAELAPDQQFGTVQFSIDGTCGPIFGCTDANATNYNPEANVNDGSCIYPVLGCTDSTALNYNPYATEDDGSCLYDSSCADNLVIFTLDPGIFANEASFSIVDANGFVLAGGSGGSYFACLPDGCYSIQMFDSFGDGWDGGGLLTVTSEGVIIGTYALGSGLSFDITSFGVNAEGCVPEVFGCTDPTAYNYNPAANVEDGSCFYPESCDGNFVYIDIYTQSWGSEISWQLVGADGAVYAAGDGYSSWGYYSTYACVPDGCYQLQMNDSWGDGWNGAYYMINSASNYYEGSLFYGSTSTDLIGVNSDCGLVAGCMDPEALNYNPNATFDDGSCTFNNSDFTGVGLGLEMEFSIYPNPANSEMVVNLTNLDQQSAVQISILSLEGKQVNNYQISNNETSKIIPLDVSMLSAGYYLVQVTNGDHFQVLPLIKQ